MRSFLKKILVLATVVAVVALGAGIDALIAKTYDVEIVSVERLGDLEYYDDAGNVVELPPDTGVADGTTYVRFTVTVIRKGKPIGGHTLYALTNRNVIGRSVTDENGTATFDYRCYRASGQTAPAVTFTVRDESNSVFVFVPAKASCELTMFRPGKEGGSGLKTDDIFYPVEGKEGEE